MPVRKPESLPGNLVNERRGDLGAAVDSNIAVSNIVTINYDDIGALCGRKESSTQERRSESNGLHIGAGLWVKEGPEHEQESKPFSNKR